MSNLRKVFIIIKIIQFIFKNELEYFPGFRTELIAVERL